MAIVVWICIGLFLLCFGYKLYHEFRLEVTSFFKESQYLNYYYQDVDYIEIISNFDLAGDARRIEIDDKEIIENLFNYINRLEIIEGISPRYSHLEDKGSFMICILRHNGDSSEIVDEYITFTTRYLSVGGKLQGYKYYYIKDSDYKPIDKSTKISRYLYDLLND